VQHTFGDRYACKREDDPATSAWTIDEVETKHGWLLKLRLWCINSKSGHYLLFFDLAEQLRRSLWVVHALAFFFCILSSEEAAHREWEDRETVAVLETLVFSCYILAYALHSFSLDMVALLSAFFLQVLIGVPPFIFTTGQFQLLAAAGYNSKHTNSRRSDHTCSLHVLHISRIQA